MANTRNSNGSGLAELEHRLWAAADQLQASGEFAQKFNQEEQRHIRENLTEEELAVLDEPGGDGQ